MKQLLSWGHASCEAARKINELLQCTLASLLMSRAVALFKVNHRPHASRPCRTPSVVNSDRIQAEAMMHEDPCWESSDLEKRAMESTCAASR